MAQSRRKGPREGQRGNPGLPDGTQRVAFNVQANVWEHLKSLVREGGIGGDPNQVAWYLFTQEVLRSMRDPALHRVPKEEWQKAQIEDGPHDAKEHPEETEEG